MFENKTVRPRPVKMLYSYEGPVYHYDSLVGFFKSETIATSSCKAKANLAYQWRNTAGFTNQYKVTLPGILTATPLK